MRQVPGSSQFLLIGDGRLARHLAHYLGFESIHFETWKRAQGRAELEQKVSESSHILLAISDAAIEGFYAENSGLFAGKSLVHFSGSLVHPQIPSAHPLMTFSTDLYEPSTYRRIAFVTEKGRAKFNELLPGLKNSSYEIQSALKPLYHALCVMGGNFTVMLWEKAFKEFQELGLPEFILLPYLERIALNLIAGAGGESVLTGPIARGDKETIANNLRALDGDAFQQVYRAFVSAAAQQRSKIGPETPAADGEVL